MIFWRGARYLRFQEKLRNYSKEELWKEYCGFLDISLDEFMDMQTRLLAEQIEIWSGCALGQGILKGCKPRGLTEFRSMVPLTTYEDYAEILLQKRAESLPAEPVLWIQTTWVGGRYPMKLAPYTRSMLNTYKNNMIACFMLATSTKRGEFDISVTDHMLYALAPLPFATGLLPVLLNEEIDISFLPPVKEAVNLSFKERNKKGFKLGMSTGIEYFFGLGSVTYFVSKSLGSMGKGSTGGETLLKKIMAASPKMMLRYLSAKKKCKEENRELMPKDLFQLKGFMCAGTDNECYKDDLEELWGIRPMEIFAGTEPTCIGTETWTRSGMYFFPDACFYEFIPEGEMLHNFADPSYVPRTVLMNEVVSGEKYEIVITVFKGGAFVRYRVGDVYRCVGLTSKEDQTRIPRFAYIDRVPWVIDIAGFTRITEDSIVNALGLSGLRVADWFAAKEYSARNRPLVHLYVEMKKDALVSAAVSVQVLKEHLSVYFKYVDQDYADLQKILDIDPLEITIVKCGTFAGYEKQYGSRVQRINPSAHVVSDFLEVQQYRDISPEGGMQFGKL